MDEHWWSIEIFDAERAGYLSADRWRDVFSPALIEAAITNGAFDWNWVRTDWGVVFEVAFGEYDAWSVFRDLPVVRAALDAAPDPVNGVTFYPGRGGGSASRVPRKPKPIAGAGGAPLPDLPDPVLLTETLIERPPRPDVMVA
jgi:hypothetical protein